MHKSYVLAVILGSFLIGIAVGSTWRYVLESHLLILIGIGLCVLVVSAYQRTFGETVKGRKRRKIGFLAGLSVLVVAFGIFYYQRFDSEKNQLTRFNDVIVGGKGVPVTVRGYVAGPLEKFGTQTQFPFRVLEIVVPNRRIPADEKILVIIPGFQRGYRYGDFFKLTAAPETPKNRGEFDYTAYLDRQGIRSIMKSPILEGDELDLSFAHSLSRTFLRTLESVRISFEASLQQSVPEPHAAYLAGILLGSRENIPEDLSEAFRRTGSSHILAISGYNIALVAQGVLVVLFFWFRRKKAFWVTTIIIFLFVVLTGASSSVVRAAIMGLLFLFGTGYGRLYDAKISLLVAATIMVLLNPFVLVFDVGFQLSFLAVIGLLYLHPLLSRAFKKIPEGFGLRDVALMTIAAQLITLPLIVGYFKSVSLVALLVNLLVLPVVPLAMLFAFVSGIAGIVFLPLGKVIGVLAWAVSSYQLGVIRFFSELSLAAVSVTVPWAVIFLLYALIFLFIWRMYKKYELI